VNAVAPGLIETDLHAANGAPDRLARLAPSIPVGRAGKPQEVAEAVLWLLSREAPYSTGDPWRLAEADNLPWDACAPLRTDFAALGTSRETAGLQDCER